MRRYIEPLMGRRWLVWTLIGLAVVVMVASSLTIWVKRQALDTDNWVDASTRLLQDDEVRPLVAAEMVDTIFANSDIEGLLQRSLPPRFDSLAAPATGVLRQSATTAANELLERPAVQDLWAEANRRAHTQLVAILDDDTGTLVSTDGGEVVLDLRPLIARLAERIGVTVELPPDAGRVTVMRSDQLEAAQSGVSAIRKVSQLLSVLVILLFAVAIYLATGFRREAVRAVAFGLIGAGILLLVARRLIGDAVIESLTSPATEDAGFSAWLIGTGLLRELSFALLTYGLVLLLGAFLAGPTRWAQAIRRRLAPAMRDRLGLVYAGVAVAFLLFLLWAPGSGSRRVLGILALAAFLACGVEILRRQIGREHPTAPGG